MRTIVKLALWGIALCNSLQLLAQTDITNSSGTLTAQYNDSPTGEDISKVIDNLASTKYLTFHSSAWIGFQTPSAVVVNKYTITSANDADTRDPLSWTFSGSNDGTTWTTLDTRSNEDFPSRLQLREFTFSNSTAYQYYRLQMSNNSGTILQLAEWEIFTAGSSSIVDITDYSGGTTSDQYNVTGAEGNAKLIDNSIFSKYLTFNATTWVQFQAANSAVVTSYAITSANDAPTRDPKNWTFQGSNDGTNWTTLHTVTNHAFLNRFQKSKFSFSNTTSYTRYRLNITANAGATITQLAEWEIYGVGTGTIPAPAAPTSLSVQNVSGNQNILTWTDNATSETQFRVERSSNGSTWNLLRNAPANTFQIRDTGLTGGNTFYYRVRAENATASSAYSNTVNTTTVANDFPQTWQEHWFEHNQIVNKVYSDQHVAIYFDNDMSTSITWMNSVVSQAWAYTKSLYGGFSDPRLYAVFHQDKYGGGSPATYFVGDRDYRNAICLGSSGNWNSATGWNLDATIHEIGHIVEGASRGVKESPAFPLWGDSKWCVIYQYDVYQALGWTAEATRWYNSSMATVDSYPRANTYWFRDWFYPIWNNYGHGAVLANYYNLLSQYFPQQNQVYARNLNWGEFVHFWSGAAGVNLKAQATTAFGWTSEYEAQFNQARIDFPFTYNDNLLANVEAMAKAANDASQQKAIVSAEQQAFDNSIRVWPNPSSDKIVRIAGPAKQQRLSVEIYSLNGVRVYTGVIQQTANINLQAQAAGVYFVICRDGKMTSTKKIILP
ncbi:putative secreted protein (Por secretion system target) [Chitinophaga skermanii]|uniref:Putative secreted protein (Por secretion system target) n=1 Tax=Chitinophaga skermanii TaxID=331697 RepID=A0A327R1Z2_9BACT|nr:discoidin domain-containing protein [Chitinophaga skermanii]RAJ10690.1 putative secreted protein (Por secretion system target) [Chitinophaga skermanii]